MFTLVRVAKGIKAIAGTLNDTTLLLPVNGFNVENT
jgi:hypothetical protein